MPSVLTPNAILAGYRLCECVGRGGQGEVWKANPVDGSPAVALKVVRLSSLGTSTSAIDRIRHEGRVLASLKHPGLVRCHKMFELFDEDLLVLILDWIDGRPLSDWMNTPELTAVHRGCLLKHLAEVLNYLHTQGVVHRDLKPANVLLTKRFFDSPHQDGGVYLVDLGIARAPTIDTRLTNPGQVVGTPAYIAPERMMSGDPEVTDHPAVDLFSFGVIGWQLWSGQHPTGLPPRSNLQQYWQAYNAVQAGQYAYPQGDVPPEWRLLLERYLSIDPADRVRDEPDQPPDTSGTHTLAAPLSTRAPVSTPVPTMLSTYVETPASSRSSLIVPAVPSQRRKRRSNRWIWGLSVSGFVMVVSVLMMLMAPNITQWSIWFQSPAPVDFLPPTDPSLPTPVEQPPPGPWQIPLPQPAPTPVEQPVPAPRPGPTAQPSPTPVKQPPPGPWQIPLPQPAPPVTTSPTRVRPMAERRGFVHTPYAPPGDYGALRLGPSLGTPVIETIQHGGAIMVLGKTEDSEWYQVRSAVGNRGYMHKQIVRLQ